MQQKKDSDPRDGERTSNRLRRLTSAELFEAAREIVIEHGGQEYRLRITGNNKLILTK